MGGAAYTDNVGVPAGCAGRTSVGGHTVGACYFPAYEYLGYFNPRKCYTYASTQFNPTSNAASLPNHTCSGEWSGNFLNWLSMTAIDMFIMTMTGGNRIVDTAGASAETVVRRARKTDNDSWFPIKYVDSGTNVAPSSVTPYSDATLYFYNTTFGFNVATSFDEARAGSGTGFKASFTTAVRVCSSIPAGLAPPASTTRIASPTARTPSRKARFSAMRAPSVSERSATAPTARTPAMAVCCART
jgi:type IV pilus assembly protein PilY1